MAGHKILNKIMKWTMIKRLRSMWRAGYDIEDISDCLGLSMDCIHSLLLEHLTDKDLKERNEFEELFE